MPEGIKRCKLNKFFSQNLWQQKGKLTKPGNKRGEIGVGSELNASNKGQTEQRLCDYLGKYVCD